MVQHPLTNSDEEEKDYEIKINLVCEQEFSIEKSLAGEIIQYMKANCNYFEIIGRCMRLILAITMLIINGTMGVV